ncbi:MAG: hypothetical protein K940chlam2_00987, partial [Chlamydiae bacterium]|nr:hypothetical protein [Chlamydiota bacterium]
MKRWWLFFILLCSPLLAIDEKPPTLKVLACKLSEKVRIDVQGPFKLTTIDSGELILNETKGRHGPLTTTEKGLKWREVFANTFEMRIIPTHEKTTISLDGQPFKGCLEIYSIGGTLNIVNEIDIENYLERHLGEKGLQNQKPHTLEAVAIIARTHLHYIAERGAYATWQVPLTKKGYPHPQKYQSIASAAKNTRGQILTYKGKPFPTTWTANAAGETVSYSAMFRKGKNETPPGASLLPSHMTRERKTWSLSLRPERLLDVVDLPDFSQIELFHAEGTRKVYALRFSGDKGYKDVDFFRFQKALGSHLLRSNDFTVSLQGDRIVFSGYGEGIGVGL